MSSRRFYGHFLTLSFILYCNVYEYIAVTIVENGIYLTRGPHGSPSVASCSKAIIKGTNPILRVSCISFFLFLLFS